MNTLAHLLLLSIYIIQTVPTEVGMMDKEPYNCFFLMEKTGSNKT